MAFSIDTAKQLGLSVAEAVKPKKQALGQEQFLKLMTTQMTHQDPTKPMENGDFLAQMAQFSTVEGIGSLNNSFNAFAGSMTSSQSIEASGLVGKRVSVPSNQGVLGFDSPLAGNIKLNSATNQATVSIKDQTGAVVKTLNLGSQSEGMKKFEWDGLLEDGSYATPGIYKIEAQATIDGQNTALETFMGAKVESVDLGDPQKGVVLNLGQLGAVEFSKVKQVF
ncbi:MAG: flagellar hook assembly protein FlgD [Methyloprofundus sp.]|nr:flagellar hook assembly protein FlgD [Methyloprofundus sp.]MBW6454009.1 flagellar hook assembly protein FlgD [Methyloprofundus sp.]